MVAWSTLAQAVFVVGGIIVALWQLKESRMAENPSNRGVVR